MTSDGHVAHFLQTFIKRLNKAGTNSYQAPTFYVECDDPDLKFPSIERPRLLDYSVPGRSCLVPFNPHSSDDALILAMRAATEISSLSRIKRGGHGASKG